MVVEERGVCSQAGGIEGREIEGGERKCGEIAAHHSPFSYKILIVKRLRRLKPLGARFIAHFTRAVCTCGFWKAIKDNNNKK